MPVTRRKRATPPEENTNQGTEVTAQAGEHTAAQEPTTTSDTTGVNDRNGTASTSEQASSLQSASPDSALRPKERTHTRRVRREEPLQSSSASPTSQNTQIENSSQPVEPMQSQSTASQQQPMYTSSNTASPAEQQSFAPPVSQTSQVTSSPLLPSTSSASERERPERSEYTPSIEPGRRTARGELFRRPPQIPSPHSGPNHQSVPTTPSQVASPAPVQANPPHTHVSNTLPTPPTPTHEINLPLGNLLHLAYNPGYTGAEEARSTLLHKLENESKAGGRARCWNCGSLAVVYDRWNTRSKTFGEVGVAICEVCGAWSVL